jgi:hypothetical protein
MLSKLSTAHIGSMLQQIVGEKVHPMPIYGPTISHFGKQLEIALK